MFGLSRGRKIQNFFRGGGGPLVFWYKTGETITTFMYFWISIASKKNQFKTVENSFDGTNKKWPVGQIAMHILEIVI